MSKEYLAVSDGTYTLTETDAPNQFYFYRNDDGVLGEVDHEPMDLYHAYIMNKMMNGEITDIVANNIRSQISSDGKCMRLLVAPIGEEPKAPEELEEVNLNVPRRKPKKNVLQKIKRFLLGKSV